MMTEGYTVIAELVVSCLGEGTSISKYVKHAVSAIEGIEGIRLLHHPMGTVIEADSIEKILEVTKRAHEAMFEAGCKRVITTLKIDDRRDKKRKMEDKVEAITK